MPDISSSQTQLAQRSTESMQQTAKWTIAAFGGVAVFVIGQLGLTGFDNILNGDGWSIWLFAVGVSIAVAAIAGTVLLGAQVLRVPFKSISDISELEFDAQLRRAQEQAVGKTATDWSDCNACLGRVRDARTTLFTCRTPIPKDLRLETDSETAEWIADYASGIDIHRRRRSRANAATNAKHIDDLVEETHRIVDFANAVSVDIAYRRFRWMVGSAFVMGVLGVVLISVAVWHLDKPRAIDESVAVRVYLADGVTASSLGFGDRCSARQFAGVAIDGTFDSPTVVVAAHGSCSAQRITFASDDAVVVPVVAAATK